jgi:hypothetical protein
MRRFFASVLVASVLVGTPACHAPVTVTTPQGKAAFTADQVAARVSELENATIAAQAQGQIPLATARVLVEFCVSSGKTLAAAPAGWQATVGKAWAEAKKQLPATLSPLVQSAVNLVDTTLAALGGN